MEPARPNLHHVPRDTCDAASYLVGTWPIRLALAAVQPIIPSLASDSIGAHDVHEYQVSCAVHGMGLMTLSFYIQPTFLLSLVPQSLGVCIDCCSISWSTFKRHIFNRHIVLCAVRAVQAVQTSYYDESVLDDQGTFNRYIKVFYDVRRTILGSRPLDIVSSKSLMNLPCHIS